MKSFFENLFGGKQEPPRIEKHPEPAARKAPEREELGLYKTGDVIGGKYEVRATLGKGGFAVVYLVYAREIKEVCALKTFRDELLADASARDAFMRETLLWVNLEQHPFILAALWVTEISGRLFVVMQHVAPDAHGRVSLADHLARARGPLDASQTLKWAIQFCLGMEHAQARGIKSHRDIKPANILITQDGTVKISDFGLATAAAVAWRATGGVGGSLVTRGSEGAFGLSLMQTGGKARCGTPGYMAPEIYRGEGADIRSDIYSFGLVFWQMAAGSPMPPFVVPYRGDLEGYLRQIYEQQMNGRVPRVDGFLGPVIERCLYPKPTDRFGSFGELRAVLEPMLARKTGEKIEVPQVRANRAAFLNNKGASLAALGQHQEAIGCFDQSLAIDTRDAYTWLNKGASLAALGRREEAIQCYDKALAIDPREAKAWLNKGSVLIALDQKEEALNCYDQALASDPRYAEAWSGKGNALAALGRQEEAISCYDRALALDPTFAGAWYNKGGSFDDLGRREEAISCYDRALTIDPRKAAAWLNKALSEQALGRRREAVLSYRKFIEVAPPQYAPQIARARQRLQELQASQD
jgi:tetratricopeptide (TPR) repeat protein